MRALRCSSLPMLFKCGHSQDDTDLLIEAASGASDLGTAAHDAMTSVVDGRPVDLELVARRHGVEVDELGPLVWYGRQAWEELRGSFPNPATEVETETTISGVRITGHLDLRSETEDEIRFLDWKTGRKEESDHYAQIAGYALCELLTTRGVQRATGTVVWLRSQTIETFTFTRHDVQAFASRLFEYLAELAPYRYGEHCVNCRRSHDCRALIETARRDVEIFSLLDEQAIAEKLAALEPSQIVTLRRRAKVVSKFAESLDTATRRVVAERGPLDSGDGYALSLVEENGKREIDTLKAWPILQGKLEDEELAECVTVSAARVDEVVGKKAGRGKGAEAKRQLAAELTEAGALTQPKVSKLKEVRLPREQKGE